MVGDKRTEILFINRDENSNHQTFETLRNLNGSKSEKKVSLSSNPNIQTVRMIEPLNQRFFFCNVSTMLSKMLNRYKNI